jgi:hypothetical protein
MYDQVTLIARCGTRVDARELDEERRLVLEAIRWKRKELRRMGPETQRLYRLTLRQHAARCKVPPRRLWHDWARNLWESARAPMKPGLPCGYDDYIGELKEHRAQIALAIWREIGRPLP